jgi:hypothetical protein
MIKETFAKIKNDKKTPFLGCKSPILRLGKFLDKNTPRGFLNQKSVFNMTEIFR